MFYCCVESDKETIKSIKQDIEKDFRSVFGSFQEADMSRDTIIDWYATAALLEDFENLIRKYPSSEFEIVSREEEPDSIGCSIYAPGDGTAKIAEFEYAGIMDEDEFYDACDDDDPDYDGYLEECYEEINDDPEHNAKTARNTDKFV